MKLFAQTRLSAAEAVVVARENLEIAARAGHAKRVQRYDSEYAAALEAYFYRSEQLDGRNPERDPESHIYEQLVEMANAMR